MNLQEWKDTIRDEAGLTEGAEDVAGAVVEKVKFKWRPIRSGFRAVVPRSRAKAAYRATVKAAKEELSQRKIAFKAHPSYGDLLEDEMASTVFNFKGGKLHVTAEVGEDDRKFDLAVFLQRM